MSRRRAASRRGIERACCAWRTSSGVPRSNDGGERQATPGRWPTLNLGAGISSSDPLMSKVRPRVTDVWAAVPELLVPSETVFCSQIQLKSGGQKLCFRLKCSPDPPSRAWRPKSADMWAGTGSKAVKTASINLWTRDDDASAAEIEAIYHIAVNDSGGPEQSAGLCQSERSKPCTP